MLVEMERRRDNLVSALQQAVNILFDAKFVKQSTAVPDSAKTSSIIKGLTSKEGRIRGNMMGKRSNFTARTVAGGDAYLRADEIGLPYSICKVLTHPERVTRW